MRKAHFRSLILFNFNLKAIIAFTGIDTPHESFREIERRRTIGSLLDEILNFAFPRSELYQPPHKTNEGRSFARSEKLILVAKDLRSHSNVRLPFAMVIPDSG